MRTGVIAKNRKARFNYDIVDKFEAGLVLVGTEVKSLRDGTVNLKDAYGKVRNGEIYLLNCHISPYFAGNRMNHDPERPRKLLLKKRQIRRLIGKLTEHGFSLIPLEMYFNKKGIAKVMMGLGKGKAKYDKRHVIKERDVKRDLARDLKGM